MTIVHEIMRWSDTSGTIVPSNETRQIVNPSYVTEGARLAPCQRGRTPIGGLRGAVEAEIVPRLLRAHGPPRDCPCAAAPVCPVLRDGDIGGLATLLLREEFLAAVDFVEARRRRGLPLETVYLDLLAPTARYLGELWSQDRCSFAEVTLAMHHLRLLLRDMSPVFLDGCERADPRMRILLTTMPGDQHSFGLQMVADFFRRAGWDVRVDAPVTRDDLLDVVRGDWFGVVGLSVGCVARTDSIAAQIRSIRSASRNRSVGIMVGGAAFSLDPDLVAGVGADTMARDGREAPDRAQAILGDEGPRR